jgi:peptidyl-dipeptidase Dcp
MRSLLLGVSLLALVACAGHGATRPETTNIPEASVVAQAANPLLATWTGPYGGVPPWDQVRASDFEPAFEAAIAARRAEYLAIANSAEPATFDNTIAAMERSGHLLDRVGSIFGVMTSNIGGEVYDALDASISPKLAVADDEITFNPGLFARIERVYQNRASLNPEQRRLTELTYDSFVRQGARLNPAQKQQLGQINEQLASLFAEFSAKVTADGNRHVLVEREADLAGMPANMIAAFRAAAARRDIAQGFAVDNTRSSVEAVLTSASNRSLRERVWRQFVNRGDGADANDTNEVIRRILELRAARARLLEYPSHAHWRMSNTMARDPQAAMDLMMRVWRPAVARVNEEVGDMRALARRDGLAGAFEPWDYLYYAEKVRKERYDLDAAELQPYFELNNMINAAFYMAERLYGMSFREITGTVPVFEPNVRVWEVTDKASGRHIGLFYGDNYARPGKRSGAWMTSYRVASTFDGPITAIVSNNNNFVAGAPGEPVLISLDDAETLFHEFGHALHYLSMTVSYPSLSGTPRDFVEFPSQVHEHWVLSREILDRFARHYQTNQPMPQALIDKVRRAQTFNQGYATVSYLSGAIVDMKLHMRPDGAIDPDAFEREALAQIGMPREIVMRHRLPAFLHLFGSDAYSAGYYSYLWSEVMDADAWQAFEEAGNVFDPETARRFQALILANGNAIDRAEAFRQFRGRDPDVRALLEVRGFPTGDTPAAPPRR